MIRITLTNKNIDTNSAMYNCSAEIFNSKHIDGTINLANELRLDIKYLDISKEVREDYKRHGIPYYRTRIYVNFINIDYMQFETISKYYNIDFLEKIKQNECSN